MSYYIFSGFKRDDTIVEKLRDRLIDKLVCRAILLTAPSMRGNFNPCAGLAPHLPPDKESLHINKCFKREQREHLTAAALPEQRGAWEGIILLIISN